MRTADQKLAAGTSAFTLLISTSGGSVYHGLTAYNYLRGIPAAVTTHNFGSVDSIGVALYCAGQQRLCVPQARFLMHPVSMNFREGASYEEPKLLELVKSLRVDMENCASVVAANTRPVRASLRRQPGTASRHHRVGHRRADGRAEDCGHDAQQHAIRRLRGDHAHRADDDHWIQPLDSSPVPVVEHPVLDCAGDVERHDPRRIRMHMEELRDRRARNCWRRLHRVRSGSERPDRLTGREVVEPNQE
jgi:hypothetical protein